jgi:hypothetical protein
MGRLSLGDLLSCPWGGAVLGCGLDGPAMAPFRSSMVRKAKRRPFSGPPFA